MRDSEIVASIVAGEADGLAEAYDRYADILYGYCRSLLREPADAADAVQDTFVITASRLGGLRDPELLRPWLYAVARNECLRRLGSREVASILDETPEAAEHADETADVGEAAERAETRALLRAALGGLNSAERDVVTQLLHGLDVAEIALVLDVSRNHVHALLSRARDQLEASVGVLLVARSGREDCPQLAALLTGWDGQLTVLLRKRAAKHIERCEICSGRRRQVLTPAMLLGLSPGALAGVIAAREAGAAAHAVPAGLSTKALHMATGKDLHAEAYRGALLRSHPSFRTSGFPKPLQTRRPGLLRSPHVQVAAAAVAAAVIATAVVLATSGAPRHSRAISGGPLPGRTSVGQSPGGTPGKSPAGAISRGGAGGSSVPGAPVASVNGSSGPQSPSPESSGTPSAFPSGTGSPSPSASSPSPAPTTTSGSPSSTPTGQPAAGTLSVTPTTIVLTPLLGSTFTLTAEGGPVSWSISEPASLIGELNLSQSSGTLSAGQSTQVTVTVSGLASLDTQLTISPGAQAVTVLLGVL